VSSLSQPRLSFDLVTTTLGRTTQVRDLLESLEHQTHRAFRVLLVDQNDDDRLSDLMTDWSFPIEHLHSTRGISRGRNAGLPHVRADVVAFPDDDCRYPPGLLGQVAAQFTDRTLDGVTGRLVDSAGALEAGSWRSSAFMLAPRTVWYGAVSATVFLRRGVVERVGEFDELLGLGATIGDRSSEEIDYLVRALSYGARIRFTPNVVVEHPPKDDAERWSHGRATRDGESMGYILRKHGYPVWYAAWMLVRPLGGMVVSSARGDFRRAWFYYGAFKGRLRGLRPSSSAGRSVG
jgi:glycosyltransferase involved in cell wall biosynthesis